MVLKRTALCVLAIFLLACPAFASPWSKAFVPEGLKVPGANNWTVKVDKLGSWMESYSISIQWNKLVPSLGTWDINGEPKNLVSISPTKLVITNAYGVEMGQNEAVINARARVGVFTAVARSKEPLYAFTGYIQHVEGLVIPVTVMWDYDATKARLIMGDETWTAQEEPEEKPELPQSEP